jgi:predicted site-specific integrase-resolvase
VISERYMPLAKAAKLCGVSPKTMRRWLEKDRGLVFHQPKFQRVLVAESDVQAVIAKRTGARDWSGSRVKAAS